MPVSIKTGGSFCPWLLVKLQILINTQFNVKLSLINLFDAVSLGAMAAKIEAAPSADLIDWKAETSVESANEFETSIIPVKTSGRRVLVTGSTGFLGRRLVQAFAASDDVSEMYYVAVRFNSKKLVQSSEKIKIHAGDLAPS